MPKNTKIVSISLPQDLQSTLDAEASRQRRSRSFVVAEAVRDYVSRQERSAFSGAQEQTLREGLAMTPAQRLELSEELWQELNRGRRSEEPWTALFDTFDDYERWRRQGGRQGA